MYIYIYIYIGAQGSGALVCWGSGTWFAQAGFQGPGVASGMLGGEALVDVDGKVATGTEKTAAR